MTELTNSSGRPKLLALEGLRGLCALSILVSHISHDSTGFRTGGMSHFPGYVPAFISYFGGIGVLVFFVLSGFVIGYTNQGCFNRANVVLYLKRRFIRLYPIYLLVILISFAVANEFGDVTKLLGHLFFLQTWLVDNVSSNGVLWTLHLEAGFYLLYLFIWWRPVYLRLWLAVCAGACFFSPFCDIHLLLVLGYFYLWLLGLKLAQSVSGSGELPNDTDPSMRRAFWLSLFVSIAYITSSVPEILVSRYQVSGHGQLSLLSVFMLSGLLVTLVSVPLGQIDWRHFYLSLTWATTSSALAVAWAVYSGNWNLIYSYQMASIYLLLAGGSLVLSPAKIEISGLLSRAAWWGSISYSLYLIQNPIERTVFPLISKSSSIEVWWSVSFAVFMIVVVTSCFLELVLQPRIANFLRKKLL